MDSSASTLILPPLSLNTSREGGIIGANNIIFDTSVFDKQSNTLPTQFLWPQKDLVSVAQDKLKDPPINLKGFYDSDQDAINLAATQIRIACLKHGFFQVINHGIDETLIRSVHQHMDSFFNLPLREKVAIRRNPGGLCGYSGAHADRFSTKLPWKETFSFTHKHANNRSGGLDVVEYIQSGLGQEFEDVGFVYQKYCEAMENLSMVIFELLAISLGVDRLHYKEFFKDACSLMRGNNYPPCKAAGLTFGTGPHSDPNSLTILHQDEVGGLEIFSDNKWQAIAPRPDAFVVNIGDTFMALSNGKYKSCLHRAVVNKERVRRSLVYFVNPKEDKIVRPPHDLRKDEEAAVRVYPDFTWSDLKEFTQNHYRADTTTLQNFVNWLSHPKTSSFGY